MHKTMSEYFREKYPVVTPPPYWLCDRVTYTEAPGVVVVRHTVYIGPGNRVERHPDLSEWVK